MAFGKQKGRSGRDIPTSRLTSSDSFRAILRHELVHTLQRRGSEAWEMLFSKNPGGIPSPTIGTKRGSHVGFGGLSYKEAALAQWEAINALYGAGALNMLGNAGVMAPVAGPAKNLEEFIDWRTKKFKPRFEKYASKRDDYDAADYADTYKDVGSTFATWLNVEGSAYLLPKTLELQEELAAFANIGATSPALLPSSDAKSHTPHGVKEHQLKAMGFLPSFKTEKGARMGGAGGEKIYSAAHMEAEYRHMMERGGFNDWDNYDSLTWKEKSSFYKTCPGANRGRARSEEARKSCSGYRPQWF